MPDSFIVEIKRTEGSHSMMKLSGVMTQGLARS